jgi:hypothetical protein
MNIAMIGAISWGISITHPYWKNPEIRRMIFVGIYIQYPMMIARV